MKQKTRILIYILIAIAVIILGSIAIITNHNANRPVTAQEKIDLGHAYLLDLSYEKAVLEFTEAIEIEPMNADAYLGLAEAYQGMGDIDKAIEALETGYENTGDQRLKDKLDELSPSEETTVTTAETAVTSTTAKAGTDMTIVENDDIINTETTVSVEDNNNNELLNEAKQYAKYIDDIIVYSKSNNSKITVSSYAVYSNSVINNTDLFYTPQYFIKNIVDNSDFDRNEMIFYQLTRNNLLETIANRPIVNEYHYIAYDSDSTPYSEIINCQFNEYYYDSDSTPHYEYSIDLDYPCVASLPWQGAAPVLNSNLWDWNEKNTDIKYDTVELSDGLKYNTLVIPSIDNVYMCASHYISEDFFKGFYCFSNYNGIYTYYYWTDINENGFTYYHIYYPVKIGDEGPYFSIEKDVVNIGYPDNFDESIWNRIHNIDEVKAALNK